MTPAGSHYTPFYVKWDAVSDKLCAVIKRYFLVMAFVENAGNFVVKSDQFFKK